MKYPKLAKKHEISVVEQIEQIRFCEYQAPVGTLFTTCLLFGENGTILARGVSLCSIQDGFNAKQGRNRAIGRAIKALTNMKNDDPIKYEVRDEDEMIPKFVKVGKTKSVIKVPKFLHLKEAAKHYAYKSEYLPTPTEFEMEEFGL